MKISDIEAHLDALKNKALEAMCVDEVVRSRIALVDSPKKEMGDRGFPAFALGKSFPELKPPAIAAKVKTHLDPLVADDPLIAEIKVTGPYVNFKFDAGEVARLTIEQLLAEGDTFGAGFIADPEHYMIEYSAPNTNKPQHLGHVRNDLLGATVAKILDFAGHKVTRVNLINDRGIHICKSMLAYQRFGEGETPESAGIKGDHLVGKYYVVFNTKFVAEYAEWQGTPAAAAHVEKFLTSKGGQKALEKNGGDRDAVAKIFFKKYQDKYFNNESELGQATKAMLVAWEEGDEDVRALWNTMNQWVFDGFDETYARLGVGFDRVYYESNTYLLGKDLVQQGMDKGVFREIEGGAVACDLTQIKMKGDKILLRSDGTSVYMTQDLGTAMQRFAEENMDQMIYVVGDEQRHHFKVLFGVLGLLDPELEGRLKHLSYGMVELPRGMGRMKSREGTVVDADDLMASMVELASEGIKERLATEEKTLSDEELAERAEAIGMAALKFFILDFNPTTTVHFDPTKALDFTGRTGPYGLYTYARIQSIGREVGFPELNAEQRATACAALGTELELELLSSLRSWPHSLHVAARDLDPSKVTEFMHNVCKNFNKMYNDKGHRIKGMEGPRRDGLLLLAQASANAIATALGLIGVNTLDQM